MTYVRLMIYLYAWILRAASYTRLANDASLDRSSVMDISGDFGLQLLIHVDFAISFCVTFITYPPK